MVLEGLVSQDGALRGEDGRPERRKARRVLSGVVGDHEDGIYVAEAGGAAARLAAEYHQVEHIGPAEVGVELVAQPLGSG